MALLEPVYAVGDGHGRFPVRDKDDGLFVLLIPEGLEDDALVDAVDIACRLVEQYEPAAPQEGAGDADALLFTGRKAAAQRADPRPIAVGQRHYKVVDRGHAAGRAHLPS